ncbi:multidrug-efflux transporter 2 regulator [Clostridia bacterium]|nr:multidrug-efflux transporter 2 regulator [Clostridia bacterium]
MDENTLLSIKEFSKFTGIPQSTLRYYDEIGLFTPIERGENNYRYYAPMQIITVNLIRVLGELKLPLTKISELAKIRTPSLLLDALTRREDSLDAQLRQLHTAYSIIHTFRSSVQAGLVADESAISVQRMEKQPIILGGVNDFAGSETFYQAFVEFCQSAADKDINLCYPVGGYFERVADFFANPAEPTRFFSVTPTGNKAKEAGNYLVGYTRGYYGVTSDLPERLSAYAAEHKLTLTGPVYKIYLHDEISVSDPQQYLLQVSIGVEKGRSKYE